MKMWKLNVENFINSHSSKLGFWGSLFGLKGKKIQVEKNWHGETYSMSVFGNGKNIKFLVQSFTPAPPHHLPTWPGGGAVGGPPGRGLSRRQPRRLPRQLHRRPGAAGGAPSLLASPPHSTPHHTPPHRTTTQGGPQQVRLQHHLPEGGGEGGAREDGQLVPRVFK